MTDYDLDYLILIVTGTTLRAEDKDRPLAYRVVDAIHERLPADSRWRPLVISDVYYVNQPALHDCPAISIGGPGVNRLTQILYGELSVVLAVDHVFSIQMDVGTDDHRAVVWGMNHDTTVEAIETFIEKGHLDRFLAGVRGLEAA